MKGLRIKDNELSCLIEDAIIHRNDTYSRIIGDSNQGFTVDKPVKIDNILENGWSELYPILEQKTEKYHAIAGETNWGGTGFVAVKNLTDNSFEWVLHLSSMNNPIDIKIGKDIVRVTTDLNHPDGIDFIIPIQEPEKFVIETMTSDTAFNERFCTYLEYHLGNTFENSNRNDLKGYWCDGISWNPIPDNQLNKKSVNDTKKIVTKAWIGKNGQDEYEMTVRFGKYAFRRYMNGTDMTDCIPSADSMDWLDIDTNNKWIVIRLK